MADTQLVWAPEGCLQLPIAGNAFRPPQTRPIYLRHLASGTTMMIHIAYLIFRLCVRQVWRGRHSRSASNFGTILKLDRLHKCFSQDMSIEGAGKGGTANPDLSYPSKIAYIGGETVLTLHTLLTARTANFCTRKLRRAIHKNLKFSLRVCLQYICLCNR